MHQANSTAGPASEADRAYSIEEAAQRMGGVCVNTVYNEARAGRETRH